MQIGPRCLTVRNFDVPIQGIVPEIEAPNPDAK